MWCYVSIKNDIASETLSMKLDPEMKKKSCVRKFRVKRKFNVTLTASRR